MPKARPDHTAPLPDWQTLKNLDRKALAAAWLPAFGRPIPPKLYKPMVVLLLAYRLQELALGGLSPKTRRYLNALLPRPTEGKTRRSPPRRLKPGTRLLRDWQGRTHTVTAVEGGFLYGDKTHRSLSVIAKMITGTPWSGPAFFGLHKPTPRKATS